MIPDEETMRERVLRISETPNFVPQGDSISVETIVNILVQKKICSVEELFRLEGQIREKQQVSHQTEYYRIKQQSEVVSNETKHRWLRRFFIKYHWTRKLGTMLFGWRWKKVRQSPQGSKFENE
jgi:hypothetical protein